MPKVSICLPVYNGERYVANAIESALAQSFTDFEFLIADDASADASPQLIADYAAKDKRIKHWRNATNLGLFQNYNECMRQAAGDFIKPFAQDDLLAPTILEQQLSAFTSQDNLALVSCARQLIDEQGHKQKILREYEKNTVLNIDEALRENLLNLKNGIGEPSAVLFPRKFMGNGFDASFYHLGDIEYWLRIIENGKYLYLNEPLCNFRIHNQSTTNKNTKSLRFALDMVRMGHMYRGFLDKIGVGAQDYARLIAEGSASHINFLHRHKGLTLSDVLSVKPESAESALQDLASMKEVLFYSLLVAGEAKEEIFALKCEWQKERETLENRIAELLSSRSWRLTVPLRGALKLLRSHSGNQGSAKK